MINFNYLSEFLIFCYYYKYFCTPLEFSKEYLVFTLKLQTLLINHFSINHYFGLFHNEHFY